MTNGKNERRTKDKYFGDSGRPDAIASYTTKPSTSPRPKPVNPKKE